MPLSLINNLNSFFGDNKNYNFVKKNPVLIERLQRLNNPTYIGVLHKSITQKKPNNNSSSTSSSSVCSVCPPGYNSSCSVLDFGPVGGTYMQCNGPSGSIEIPLVPPDPIY